MQRGDEKGTPAHFTICFANLTELKILHKSLGVWLVHHLYTVFGSLVFSMSFLNACHWYQSASFLQEHLTISCHIPPNPRPPQSPLQWRFSPRFNTCLLLPTGTFQIADQCFLVPFTLKKQIAKSNLPTSVYFAIKPIYWTIGMLFVLWIMFILISQPVFNPLVIQMLGSI
jgi:hypothetical protein